MPCQQLEPHFVNAARKLLKNNPPIQLASVDVPKNIEVAKRYGIGNYPLLLIFRHGKEYNYTGPREEEGMWPSYHASLVNASIFVSYRHCAVYEK